MRVITAITDLSRLPRRLFCVLRFLILPQVANRKADPSFIAGNRLHFANTEQDYTRCRSEKVARAT